MPEKIKGKSKYLLYLLPFSLLAVGFIFIPLGSVIINSVFSDGGFVGLKNFKNILSNEYILTGIKNSLTLSALSVVIGMFVSFIAAYLIHSSDGKIKRAMVNIMNMTSNFQGVQLAFAFMILLGNSGVLVLLGQKIGFAPLADYDLYTASGLLATFVYFQIPLGTLLLFPAFDAVKDEYIESAELMGCTGSKFWLKVGIPILQPAILGTSSILFANAMAAYATPYAILGSNYPLLAIQISGMFTGDVVQQVDKGSAMSVLLMSFTLIISFFAKKMTPKYQGVAKNAKTKSNK